MRGSILIFILQYSRLGIGRRGGGKGLGKSMKTREKREIRVRKEGEVGEDETENKAVDVWKSAVRRAGREIRRKFVRISRYRSRFFVIFSVAFHFREFLEKDAKCSLHCTVN